MIGANAVTAMLDNGLEVVVIPDRRAPVVTHMIWYKVGAADEPPGRSGIAHFLEHLMFKGTTNHPGNEFSTKVAEIGGQENAFTSADYTAYFQRVAKEHLGLMMAFEADRMENLILTEEVVAPERQVVLEERAQRVDNDPGARLGETMDAMLYVNHPYGTPVIGWEDEIKALSAKSAIEYYDRYYTPNNAVLVVAGDVEPDAVIALAKETYGKVARRAEPPQRIRPAEPVLYGARIVRLADEQVRQPSIREAWLVPSYANAEPGEAEAIDLLADILGSGATSRMYRKLVVEDKLATSAGGWYQSSGIDQTRFMVYGVPHDGVTLEDLRDGMRAVIADIAENGVTTEELDRAKRKVLASAIYSQDSQSSLARIFGTSLTTGNTVADVQQWPERIQQVTAEQVQAAAKKYLTGDDSVTAYLTGKPAKDGNKS
ncbi:pitrilysin family protein [Breoghania sp. L-A4]|uniref:M16 family metallopeptidase n=1 Tax=Breoghania sp. L-A4 TaxID=2304600 RepID=UPI000E35B1AC|nr:pitrilysin family protein [Breoghania sp. L-A4]AXS39440.1 insulinase family protein [Breoghania sp. L-A4]